MEELFIPNVIWEEILDFYIRISIIITKIYSKSFRIEQISYFEGIFLLLMLNLMFYYYGRISYVYTIGLKGGFCRG